MTEELASYNNESGIVEISLMRGERHNSLTIEMFEAIANAGKRLASDKNARVAILSGDGPSFSAGLDLSVMKQLIGDGNGLKKVVDVLLQKGKGPENLAQRVATIWGTVPVPVIAVLKGVAFGGGFQIAMGCDIRVAHPKTRLCIMESRYGLIPDMGITQTLPKVISYDKALELTLSAREFEAEEALRLGLVTELSGEPHKRARELAEVICNRSPDAIRSIKQLFQNSWVSVDTDNLALEANLQGQLIGTPNQHEAVSAAMERRTPDFSSAAS